MAFLAVLGSTARDTAPPTVETRPFELLAHELDDLFFGQAKLKLNGPEGRAVFPSHLDDAVNVFRRQWRRVRLLLLGSVLRAVVVGIVLVFE